MRQIYQHIIHCSDSYHGDVKSIRQWHMERGWLDIGYHFVIKKDGVIEIGRPLDQVGAHCKGKNLYSVGTCLIGKKDFTQAQFRSLKKLNVMLEKLFPEIEVFAHYAFNADKTCPNFDVMEVLS